MNAQQPSSSGNMRIWLVVAAVGLALLVVGWLTRGNVYLDPIAMLAGAACLIVGVGGALWDVATASDKRG